MRRPSKPKPRKNPRAEYLFLRLDATEKQALDAFRALDDLMCTIERVREFLLTVEGGAR